MYSFNSIRRILNMLVIICLFMGLTGCVGKTKPSNFFLLRSFSSSDIHQPTTKDSRGSSLLIGPITLPAYLDRNQFILVKGENELILNEFNRWGEPLEDSFYRVLTENLSVLLNTAEIYAFTRRGDEPVEFQILIDVTRFDSNVLGEAHLTAFWEVLDKKRGKQVIKRKSEFKTAESAKDISALVKTQNTLLNQFSREIANTVTRELSQSMNPRAVLNITWYWESTISPVEKIMVSEPEHYAFILKDDGKVNAKFDCNRGGGNYQISEGKLSFGPLISTRMACPQDSLNMIFMRDLQRVNSFYMQDGSLFLELPLDGGTMKFKTAK